MSASAPVSVVIPAYRCAATIERAIASVHAQSLRPAEVIAVDDASGDHTLAALRSLQERYGERWLRVISLPRNSGAAAARNAGWDAATRPLIAFLDADDTWHERKIELQSGWMQANPESALSAHACVGRACPVPLPHGSGPRARRLGRFELLLTNRIATSTVMLRTDVPLRFDPEKRRSEDYLLWLQLALAGAALHLLQGLPLARRYKAPYGEAGLSGALWAMEHGELDTFRRLHGGGRLSTPVAAAAMALSMLKHVRRVARVALRARADVPEASIEFGGE